MFELLDAHGVRPNLMSVDDARHEPVRRTARTSCRGARWTRSPTARPRGIDLLIGTNLDEAALFGPAFTSLAPGVADAAFGPRATAVMDAYRRRPSGRDAMTDVTDRRPLPDPGDQARRRRPSPQPAHLHVPLRVRRAPRPRAGLGAIHGLDLPFMWDRIDDVADQVFALAGADRSPALATAMHGAWSAFVRTGRPAASRAPRLAGLRPGAARDDVARRPGPVRRRSVAPRSGGCGTACGTDVPACPALSPSAAACAASRCARCRPRRPRAPAGRRRACAAARGPGAPCASASARARSPAPRPRRPLAPRRARGARARGPGGA